MIFGIQVIIIFLILCILLLCLGACYFSEPGYEGQASPYFNGHRFFNSGSWQRARMKVWRYFRTRQPEKWIRNYESDVREEPLPLADEKKVQLTFINHASFLIQAGSVNILTDPIWSERCSPLSWVGPRRMRPPGLSFEDLPKIDIVLLSHNHYDHLDLKTLQRLERRFHPTFIVPLGVEKMLNKRGFQELKRMDWGDCIVLKGLSIEATPAIHFSGRGSLDRNKTLWCGYVIKYKNFKTFFVGDSAYGDIYKGIGERFQGIDLALIPIGAYKPNWFMLPVHMSPKQAIEVHRDLRAKKSLAMHFGTFAMADEGQGGAERDLLEALEMSEFSDQDFVIPDEGSTYSFLVDKA